MPGLKIVVMYPWPRDVATFEKHYLDEHLPMARGRLTGYTKVTTTKLGDALQGSCPFYRVAEIHFASREALEACASSEGAKEAIAHANSISSGGAPVIVIAEEETIPGAQSVGA